MKRNHFRSEEGESKSIGISPFLYGLDCWGRESFLANCFLNTWYHFRMAFVVVLSRRREFDSETWIENEQSLEPLGRYLSPNLVQEHQDCFPSSSSHVSKYLSWVSSEKKERKLDWKQIRSNKTALKCFEFWNGWTESFSEWIGLMFNKVLDIDSSYVW